MPSIRSRGSAHAAPAAEEGAKAFLSGSSASHEVVASAFFGLSRREVAATVLALPGTDRWRRSLEQWATTGDLVTLQDDFEKARVRSRVRRFVSGDPLGIDIPLAYVSAKEAEARNLRVLGQGAVEESDIQVLRTRLLLPWPGTDAPHRTSQLRRLVIVTTPELAPGYRLAGVATRIATAPAEAVERIRELIAEGGEKGIVAHARAVPAGARPARTAPAGGVDDAACRPPPGRGGACTAVRAPKHLLRMLWQAVGYQITFEPREHG